MGMGNYESRNYALDALNGFKGMSDVLVGQRKEQSDLEQRRLDNERQTKLDQQNEKVSNANIAASNASTNNSTYELDKKKRLDEDEKDLEQVLQITSLPKGSALTDEQRNTYGRVVAKISSVPNNISDPVARDTYKKANEIGVQAHTFLNQLPAQPAPISIKRGSDERVDAGMDAAWITTPTAQKIAVHTDKDGSTTGKAGSKYSLDGIAETVAVSGDGYSSTTNRFYIQDANGNRIAKKNPGGADVMTVDPKTGKQAPEWVTVPSTIGFSNDPQAKLNLEPSHLAILKSELGNKIIDDVAARPEEDVAAIQEKAQAYIRSKVGHSKVAEYHVKKWDEEQKENKHQKMIQDVMKELPPEATAGEITRALVNKGVTAKDAAGYGSALAHVPKATSHIKTEEGVKGHPGWVRDVYTSADGSGKIIKQGEPRLQFSPPHDGEGSGKRKDPNKDMSDRQKAIDGYQKTLSKPDGSAVSGDDAINFYRYTRITAGDYSAFKSGNEEYVIPDAILPLVSKMAGIQPAPSSDKIRTGQNTDKLKAFLADPRNTQLLMSQEAIAPLRVGQYKVVPKSKIEPAYE